MVWAALMIGIRKLVPDDGPEFLAIRQRALRDHPDVYTSTAEEWDVPVSPAVERIQSNTVFGAYDDNTLVGVVTLALSARKAIKQRHKTEIWSVYVAPEARRKGVAKALMLSAIAEAKRLGFMAVSLSVADGNDSALNLYKCLGFVRFGTEPGAVRMQQDGRLIDNHFFNLDLRV